MSWVIAESFAFGTNKILTYKSKGKRHAFNEYTKFLLARIFVLALETLILKITVDLIGFEQLFMKLFAMCIILILNPLLNRYVVFKKSKYISKIQLLRNIKVKLLKNNHNKDISE